jgi:hypothetical protein
MQKGKILLDDQLEPPVTGAEVIKVPFREKAGERNCSIYGIFWFLNSNNIIPIEALKQVFLENKISEKVPVDKMMEI